MFLKLTNIVYVVRKKLFSHYFFECCKYKNIRNTLLYETLSITNLSVLKILHGYEMLSIRNNMKFYDAVSRFLTSTKRFNIS